MNILAFDTCFGACSAALRLTGGTGAPRHISCFERCEQGHAEALIPMIREVIAEAGISFGDLDRIAVTAGPGTFTGTRTGIAAARGLALSTGLPLVGASSLAVMAKAVARRLGHTETGDETIVAVDARRGQVYVQLFARGGSTSRSAPLLLSSSDAARLGSGHEILVVGSGAANVAAEAHRIGRKADARLPDLQPDATDLAEMASELALADGPLHPLYLREADVTLPSGGQQFGRK